MSDYTRLDRINEIPINIAFALLENDNIFKCLKHNIKNALDLNITEDDKFLLISQDDQTNKRVYFQPFNNDIVSEARSELRFYVAEISPENNILSEVSIGFEIIVYNDLWLLENGKQRPLVMINEILKTLNGKNINGIGTIKIHDKYPCRVTKYNNSFTGYSLMMKTRLV
jgi:hypothetical protein